MKKLVSLFLIIAMISSFMIVVNAETKMSFEFGWYATKYSSMSKKYSWTEDPVETAKAGDVIAAVMYVPENSYLGCVGYFLEYDKSILELVTTHESAGTVQLQEEGLIKGAATYAPATADFNIVTVIAFKVKENPVKSLDSIISYRLDPDCKQAYNPNGGAEAYFTADDIAVNYAPLTIEGLKEETKEFKVTAADNGTDTVVTVENKGDKTGKVYVATFVGGVLDACQVKDLADGELKFEGLTGDVKVFVWDNNMVPLLDTALDA